MKRIAFVVALILLGTLGSHPAAVAQQDPRKSPPFPVGDVSSCDVPKEVDGVDPTAATGLQLPFFDNYSWRAFAALVCDADPNHRGQADAKSGRDGQGPRVFETFKSAWEVYHQGTASTIWDSYGDQKFNPCPDAAPGQLVLASTSKFLDTQQAGPDATIRLPPLPAQNRTYAHYLTQYNQTSFQYIVPGGPNKESRTVIFPPGSINVKSAWIEMTDLNISRFYWRYAWIPRSGGACESAKVGLIGFHIVQKTPNQEHWVWSTFEQVDDAPDAGCPTPSGRRYTFNDGNCKKKMPDIPPTDNMADAPPTDIFNVQRTFNPISSSTAKTNQSFQAEFKGSRWQYYQLVMSQWSIAHAALEHSGEPAYTFPGDSSESAFANTVMETFFQGDVKFGCMGCHGKVAANADFVWSLRIEPTDVRSAGLDSLAKIMVSAGIPIQ